MHPTLSAVNRILLEIGDVPVSLSVEYDRIGATSDSEALELIVFVRELRAEVIMWLQANYPELL